MHSSVPVLGPPDEKRRGLGRSAALGLLASFSSFSDSFYPDACAADLLGSDPQQQQDQQEADDDERCHAPFRAKTVRLYLRTGYATSGGVSITPSRWAGPRPKGWYRAGAALLGRSLPVPGNFRRDP